MTEGCQRERAKQRGEAAEMAAIVDGVRSYAVRVTDATFCYMAEQAAAESGVAAAEQHERMWTLFERGAVRLVGPVTDDGRVGVEPCDSNEWHEQAKKNEPLVEWRRQMAPTVATPTN
jgi:hypothetical protein